ncbi:DUF3176 domain-containing protein [Aspergillus fijiensis CBS 313.89]|uniref:Uncharacterized protein n=1 Tax=Aspergillus fijiensis CBS 313.89 TaxID=1448319 RepID=A0A8G1RP41_9EURO|nr:uncharacterized protein BO72DRAFT_461517 [Aspergillus fijiensis CBS 313.89]RAK74076.1 hypothetical protein BO72DRAFT_461517 [Aspergillus fijiensis CBS 313.89]
MGSCVSDLRIDPDGNYSEIYADDVPIIIPAKSSSNDSADIHSEHSSLSTSTKASIALGVTFGVLMVIITALIMFLFHRRKKQGPRGGYTPVRLSNYEKKVIKPPSLQDVTHHRFLWGTLGSDSWIYESIAVCLSIACLIAIACILLIYNKQLTPHLPSGVKLNTVVSILASVAKSALIFAVGQCIGQLRWITLRKARKRLASVQLYDNASRGPWGSILILLEDKYRSLVTVAALVIILALVFDPFVQQIISYPVKPTHRYSEGAEAAQSRHFQPNSSNYSDFTSAINTGIWADVIDFGLSCPTGNCTWAPYQSVEICSRCADIDPTRVVLSGWNVSLFNYSLFSPQTIPISISRINGTPSNFSIDITWRPTGVYDLLVPKVLYWIADTRPNQYLGDILSIDRVAGVDEPLVVVSKAELSLPETWPSNASDFLGVIEVTQVTECALAICAKRYNASVTNGVSSVQIMDEDLGSFYQDGYGDNCWKPSASPLTNWNDTNTDINPVGYSVDPVHYEFCGVEPGPYRMEDLLPLAGTLNKGYELDRVTKVWNSGTDYLATSSWVAKRATEFGFENVMENIAASVSKLARTTHSYPIYGVLTTQDSYVAVQWPWLALPVALLVAGIIVLVATAFITSRENVSLWKSSTLPLLFHGLEHSVVTRNMNERGPCEMASEMEQLAGDLIVDLAPSQEEGRIMLRGDSQSVEPALDRGLSRRQTF